MSILKQFGAVLLLTAFSLPLWASPAAASPGEITFKTRAVDNTSIAIQLYNLDKEKTTVQIQDRAGNVYYQKRIRNHNGFSIRLDLDQLPEGSYILQVNRENGTISQVVRVMEEGLLLSQIVEEE